MRYLPWHRLEGRPSIIVDGYPAEGTVLTLSHWRGSGSPEALADDLSTQIVFRYLDRPDLAVEAEAVSNNHFDEDGLCGIFSVLNAEEALARRDLIIDVASTGDFDTFRHREGARIAFALRAYADAQRSPLGSEVFAKPYPEQSAGLYQELLEKLPELLDAPDRFKDLWEDEDARFARDEALLAGGEITITERPEIDLAIVHAPDVDPHPSAIHNATERHRILITSGRRHILRYRYETWVQYMSRPTTPRVDLAPLVEQLSEKESAGKWSFDDVEDITPSLHLEGAEESDMGSEAFTDAVASFLAGH